MVNPMGNIPTPSSAFTACPYLQNRHSFPSYFFPHERVFPKGFIKADNKDQRRPFQRGGQCQVPRHQDSMQSVDTPAHRLRSPHTSHTLHVLRLRLCLYSHIPNKSSFPPLGFVCIYSQISLVRYRLFGRAYRNTNGIVISRVMCWVNTQEKKELNT